MDAPAVSNLCPPEFSDRYKKAMDDFMALSYVEQLRFREGVRIVCDTNARYELHVGARVSFMDRSGTRMHGILVKKNRKTFHVAASDGLIWKVSPTLLTLEV